MTIDPAETSYFLHRAEQEAIRAIQATDDRAAAIHQDLSRRYSGVARESLRSGAPGR